MRSRQSISIALFVAACSFVSVGRGDDGPSAPPPDLLIASYVAPDMIQFLYLVEKPVYETRVGDDGKTFTVARMVSETRMMQRSIGDYEAQRIDGGAVSAAKLRQALAQPIAVVVLRPKRELDARVRLLFKSETLVLTELNSAPAPAAPQPGAPVPAPAPPVPRK